MKGLVTVGYGILLSGAGASRAAITGNSIYDVTNRCNAKCITCWDHSPLLKVARSAAWKSQTLPASTWRRLLADLDAFGSVRAVVLSGITNQFKNVDADQLEVVFVLRLQVVK